MKYVSKDALYDLCQPSGVCRLHVSMIDQMPAADVQPVVHGRWEKKVVRRPFVRVVYGCTVCGRIMESASDFCPNCGANMRDGG